MDIVIHETIRVKREEFNEILFGVGEGGGEEVGQETFSTEAKGFTLEFNFHG